MNGRSEEVFPGEERVIISSNQGLSSHALKPEMKASQVTREISSNLRKKFYSLIVANLANVDVVGHTEDKQAVIRAVEEVDRQLGRIVDECRSGGITLAVTSDHGTVEEWLYKDGSVNTGHTRSPVPFILADFSPEGQSSCSLKTEGELADAAPTLLDLLCLEKPVEMTGESLLQNFHRASASKRRVLLLILDGWGMREEKEGNLIAEARTPNFDKLWSRFPRSLLKASGEAVGMPSHTVGNSEAGHFHLGAGRRVILDRFKIDKAIEDGSFFQNKAFLRAMQGAKRDHKPVHLIGIVSKYSSHGTIRHLFALLRLAKKLEVKRAFIHCLIGRRGEKAESGAAYVAKVEEMCKSLSLGQVVTVMGRFWALDREENWDRVEKAYRALVFGEGTKISFFNEQVVL
jgi:2,3-bisphosphoglycerate-independent phosphoglycerate mutase